MKNLPFYDTYEKQNQLCLVCGKIIDPQEYCVVNLPQGVKVIHKDCLKNIKVGGCLAQIEVLYSFTSM